MKRIYLVLRFFYYRFLFCSTRHCLVSLESLLDCWDVSILPMKISGDFHLNVFENCMWKFWIDVSVWFSEGKTDLRVWIIWQSLTLITIVGWWIAWINNGSHLIFPLFLHIAKIRLKTHSLSWAPLPLQYP